jgi:hypothetical protein
LGEVIRIDDDNPWHKVGAFAKLNASWSEMRLGDVYKHVLRGRGEVLKVLNEIRNPARVGGGGTSHADDIDDNDGNDGNGDDPDFEELPSDMPLESVKFTTHVTMHDLNLSNLGEGRIDGGEEETEVSLVTSVTIRLSQHANHQCSVLFRTKLLATTGLVALQCKVVVSDDKKTPFKDLRPYSANLTVIGSTQTRDENHFHGQLQGHYKSTRYRIEESIEAEWCDVGAAIPISIYKAMVECGGFFVFVAIDSMQGVLMNEASESDGDSGAAVDEHRVAIMKVAQTNQVVGDALDVFNADTGYNELGGLNKQTRDFRERALAAFRKLLKTTGVRGVEDLKQNYPSLYAFIYWESDFNGESRSALYPRESWTPSARDKTFVCFKYVHKGFHDGRVRWIREFYKKIDMEDASSTQSSAFPLTKTASENYKQKKSAQPMVLSEDDGNGGHDGHDDNDDRGRGGLSRMLSGGESTGPMSERGDGAAANAGAAAVRMRPGGSTDVGDVHANTLGQDDDIFGHDDDIDGGGADMAAAAAQATRMLAEIKKMKDYDAPADTWMLYVIFFRYVMKSGLHVGTIKALLKRYRRDAILLNFRYTKAKYIQAVLIHVDEAMTDQGLYNRARASYRAEAALQNGVGTDLKIEGCAGMPSEAAGNLGADVDGSCGNRSEWFGNDEVIHRRLTDAHCSVEEICDRIRAGDSDGAGAEYVFLELPTNVGLVPLLASCHTPDDFMKRFRIFVQLVVTITTRYLDVRGVTADSGQALATAHRLSKYKHAKKTGGLQLPCDVGNTYSELLEKLEKMLNKPPLHNATSAETRYSSPSIVEMAVLLRERLNTCLAPVHGLVNTITDKGGFVTVWWPAHPDYNMFALMISLISISPTLHVRFLYGESSMDEDDKSRLQRAVRYIGRHWEDCKSRWKLVPKPWNPSIVSAKMLEDDNVSIMIIIGVVPTPIARLVYLFLLSSTAHLLMMDGTKVEDIRLPNRGATKKNSEGEKLTKNEKDQTFPGLTFTCAYPRSTGDTVLGRLSHRICLNLEDGESEDEDEAFRSKGEALDLLPSSVYIFSPGDLSYYLVENTALYGKEVAQNATHPLVRAQMVLYREVADRWDQLKTFLQAAGGTLIEEWLAVARRANGVMTGSSSRRVDPMTYIIGKSEDPWGGVNSITLLKEDLKGDTVSAKRERKRNAQLRFAFNHQSRWGQCVGEPCDKGESEGHVTTRELVANIGTEHRLNNKTYLSVDRTDINTLEEVVRRHTEVVKGHARETKKGGRRSDGNADSSGDDAIDKRSHKKFAVKKTKEQQAQVLAARQQHQDESMKRLMEGMIDETDDDADDETNETMDE